MADNIDLCEPWRITKSVDLGGGKSVSVVEFPAEENLAVMKDVADESVETDDLWYAALAIRFIKGPDYQPTGDEVQRFYAAQSFASIIAIVRAGMALSNPSSVFDAGKKS